MIILRVVFFFIIYSGGNKRAIGWFIRYNRYTYSSYSYIICICVVNGGTVAARVQDRTGELYYSYTRTRQKFTRLGQRFGGAFLYHFEMATTPERKRSLAGAGFGFCIEVEVAAENDSCVCWVSFEASTTKKKRMVLFGVARVSGLSMSRSALRLGTSMCTQARDGALVQVHRRERCTGSSFRGWGQKWKVALACRTSCHMFNNRPLSSLVPFFPPPEPLRVFFSGWSRVFGSLSVYNTRHPLLVTSRRRFNPFHPKTVQMRRAKGGINSPFPSNRLLRRSPNRCFAFLAQQPSQFIETWLFRIPAKRCCTYLNCEIGFDADSPYRMPVQVQTSQKVASCLAFVCQRQPSPRPFPTAPPLPSQAARFLHMQILNPFFTKRVKGKGTFVCRRYPAVSLNPRTSQRIGKKRVTRWMFCNADQLEDFFTLEGPKNGYFLN